MRGALSTECQALPMNMKFGNISRKDSSRADTLSRRLDLIEGKEVINILILRR